MKKICYVATIPAVVHAFLREHIRMAADEYEVTVICNSVDKHLLEGLRANLILLPIERKPSIWRDLSILKQLIVIFRREHFDIVHSIMPKTGMLAMLAARLTCVPIRIHTFTGQVWVTARGIKRQLLKFFDRLIASLTSCALTDSRSQQEFLVAQSIIPQWKLNVLGAGSICGVDSLRFHPDVAARLAIRNELNISADSILILYVGRLTKDKGILDLAYAFDALSRRIPEIMLLLVGTEEDVKYEHIEQICRGSEDRLRYLEFTIEPERYMAAADLFCLPSYREGFGMTIIEAAACGVPAIASRVYGITDAVEEGKTGLLFPAADVPALELTILKLATDDELRRQMGSAAQARALKLFSSSAVTMALLGFYAKLQPAN